ncbi:MAG: hypothetical protein GTO62_10115 [Planctomycetales bacterium]|nr:hypothetical protein [Planctomycetales bacterium]
MVGSAKFVFVTCQWGAEAALKRELARLWPGWRSAYSRAGFVTLKLPHPTPLPDNFALRSTLARSYAISLGRASGASASQRAQQVWKLAAGLAIDRLHVWSREQAVPGTGGYEPSQDPAAVEVRTSIAAAAPAGHACQPAGPPGAANTHRGDLVLDCVLVQSNEWWVGYHRAAARATRWPGGIWPGQPPEEMVSRAYLKTSEALDWMSLPIKPGQRCVELGCAPGGSTQALLDRGLRVTGIDPANVDPRIAQQKNFWHLRKRAADVQRKEFSPFQWLIADMNVAPPYTLATVRDIVTHRLVHIRGLLLNLKLADWTMANQLPQYVEEVRSWGYPIVRARQLSHQRHEICIAGLAVPRRRRTRHHRRRLAGTGTASKPAANQG